MTQASVPVAELDLTDDPEQNGAPSTPQPLASLEDDLHLRNGNGPALISPERLLSRAEQRNTYSTRVLNGRATARAAQAGLSKLLQRMSSDSLTITDPNGVRHRFGPNHHRRTGPAETGADIGIGVGIDAVAQPAPLAATMTVTDERAWTAVAREGSIGLGRGYIEGWWHSDDPTAVVQVLIRNLHGIDDVRNRINQMTGRFGDAARRALPRPSRHRNREDIGTHYDLGNDFFRLFLDETMTYSSAVFADDLDDLKVASLAKYDRLLAKLGVTADHDILEIGTGWGGMALRTAERHGASVTTTTVSEQQLSEAQSRVASSSVPSKVRLLNSDWRDLSGTYDRIVSIEMIEAVDWRDYDRFFSTIERCLAPDGMVGLQAICVPDRRYERTKNTEDFIRRFVFPGGFLPSIGAVSRSVATSTRLQMLDVEDFSAHYARTLRLWRQRFDDRLDDIQALGLDDRFCRLWRFYLSYCEAGFLERHCTVNQIVLVGPEWRPDGLELRPL